MWRKRALIIIVIFATVAITERMLGRLWLGPDGRFGLFSWNIWSPDQSQRVIDPYTLSHFIHGYFFSECSGRFETSSRFLAD